ncbi:MAG TPA: hypothetical protein VLA58_06650 [Chitinophagaceae bacterium]|nr:hypothetical protein [Chitinophagaceae bacterium]
MFEISFLNRIPSIYLTLGVIFVMMLFFTAGAKFKHYKVRKNLLKEDEGLGPVEGSLLGLLALMLSFTFSLSNSRYDTRLHTVIEEANDIGTAILRIDLYPDSIRTPLRTEFARYVESRVEFYEAGRDLERVRAALDSTNAIQSRIWAIVSTVGQDRDHFHRSSQMIPALNAMIDITTTRTALTLAKVPDLIMFLLFMLCWTSSFMMGYARGKKNDWVITFIFAVMTGITIFTIIDLDRPRTGVITMDGVNKNISALRSLLK